MNANAVPATVKGNQFTSCHWDLPGRREFDDLDPGDLLVLNVKATYGMLRFGAIKKNNSYTFIIFLSKNKPMVGQEVRELEFTR